MSKFKTVVMGIKAGQLPPLEAIEKVIEEHKSLVGLAVVTENADADANDADAPPTVLENIIATGSDFPSAADLMSTLTDYQDVEKHLVFADFPKEYDGDSEQPYAILRANLEDPESDVIAVALMDGDWSKEADGENGADVVADVLRGTFARYMENAADMDDLMESAMTDPLLPKIINGLYKDRACITIVADNGVSHTFGNFERKEFDWGWMSQDCGFGKKTIVEQATAAAKKTVRGFGGLKNAPTTPAKTEASGGSLQGASGNDSATNGWIVRDAPDDKLYVLVTPPQLSKEPLKDAYKWVNSGIVPQKFKDRPAARILRKNWEKLCKEKGEVPISRPIANVEPVVSSNTRVENGIVPKAPPAELKRHQEQFMKRPTVIKIVNEGRSMLDPKRLEETENTYASFVEISGKPELTLLDVVVGFTNEDKADLIKNEPMLALVLLNDIINAHLKMIPIDQINKKRETTQEELPLKATGTDGTAPPASKKSTARTFGKK